jgi:hypothetical protein
MPNNYDHELDHALYDAAHDYIDAYVVGNLHTNVTVRAVYDAAAKILYPDKPDVDNLALWQLRADYIDAHAQFHDHHGSDAFHAARGALVTALTGNQVTP